MGHQAAAPRRVRDTERRARGRALLPLQELRRARGDRWVITIAAVREAREHLTRGCQPALPGVLPET